MLLLQTSCLERDRDEERPCALTVSGWWADGSDEGGVEWKSAAGAVGAASQTGGRMGCDAAAVRARGCPVGAQEGLHRPHPTLTPPRPFLAPC
eukprot:3835239-Rhodomonas_salina.1